MRGCVGRGDGVCISGGMMTYDRPKTIDKALSALRGASGLALPYAGGTDLVPRWSRGLLKRPESIVDLKQIDELRGISRVNGEVHVGACTPMCEIASDSIARSAAPVLALAAGRIACPQVRNRATIGGNLCNASPAADTAVPLILLDAVLDVASAGQDRASVREVSIADFFLGPGSTVLAPGEILTRVRFRPLPAGAFAAWDKFGTRPAMEIAVASVGIAIEINDGIVSHARVGYGSVAPVPMRGPKAEAALLGHALDAEVIEECEATARAEISPITDVRAGEAYRREVVGVMLRRLLGRAQRDG